MKQLFTLLFIIFLAFTARTQDEKYSRIKINVEPSELRTIAAQGIPHDAGYYDFKQNCFIAELPQRDIMKLDRLGFTYELLVDDVTAWYVTRNTSIDINQVMTEARMATTDYPVPQDFELGSCGGFSTIEQCYAHLDNMANLYPELITIKAPVGNLTTFENRNMYYVKISDNPNVTESEPKVLYTGMIHAREAIGMQHQLFYMYYLLENYETNQEIQDLVNNTEMYFIPIVNVDGYQRNITSSPNGGGNWRKNRRNNGDGSFGIDINRNFGFYWGYDDEGSSPYTWDDTYRGTAPFSEPETQLIKEFCETYDFKIALNYHSYSNLLLYAWGYTPDLSPDEAVFNEYAKNMTADNHYVYGPGSTTIYPTNGGSDDWMYGEQTTKEKILAYTPEVGGGNDGFWPQVSRIIPLCQENMLQSILAAKYAGTYGQLIDQTPLIVPDKVYYAIFDVKRLGQTPADYEVSVEPLGDKFESVGDPIVITGLSVLGKVTDSIPFILNDAVKSGDTIRYVIALNDGYSVYRDTVEKYYGTPVELFTDDLSNANKWTGQWALSSIFPYSPPSSMTDSPSGNYSNNANKSTILTDAVSLTNASVAVLNFQARWALEAGYDYVQVSISTNNGTSWLPLEGRYTRPGTIDQAFGQPLYDDRSLWVKEEINISQYADQDIKLKFTLRSDGGVTMDGYYFDDVSITIIDRTVNVAEPGSPTAPSYMSEGYPNPANDNVTFRYSLNTHSSKAQLIITDLSGRTIKNAQVDPMQHEVKINVTDMLPGLYMCTMTIGDQPSITRKITVRK